MTALLLGSVLPNIEVETTTGKFKLHDYQGDSWLLFFSHPADFTPVCTTELARVVQLNSEFQKRNVKLIALSCDDLEAHKSWSCDVTAYAGSKDQLPYPIIADKTREIALMFGMLDAHAKDAGGVALTARACFIFGPDRTLHLSILYPASVGRNFTEIIRVIDALQLSAANKIVTPVDWKQGESVIVPPVGKAEDYPNKVEIEKLPSGKEYLRWTTVNK